MKNKKGQITVLVLLLSMLALVGGLSVASRSLSDLKQATYVDSGTRALAAAEAGLGYGLNQVSLDLLTCGSPGTITVSGINVSYVAQCSTRDYAVQNNVAKDDVFQVGLTGVPLSVKYFDFLWSNPNASIEVVLMRADNSIERYAVNGSSVSLANGFDTSALSASSCLDSHCGDAASFSGGNCKSGYPTIVHNPGDKLIRVKPLYQSGVNIAICARNNSNGRNGLQPPQTVTVIATATTNNTVRRVQADYYPAAMPAIFDNVLYSGGNITK